MTMYNLKKAAKVMANILVAVYKLNMVVLFLLMIFSPKTYMKIENKIIDTIRSMVNKFCSIFKNKKLIDLDDEEVSEDEL